MLAAYAGHADVVSLLLARGADPNRVNDKGQAPVAGAVITVGSADYDADAEKIVAAGGQVALPKYALPGMAWQGYFLDTEGNVFGLHQPDPEAK